MHPKAATGTEFISSLEELWVFIEAMSVGRRSNDRSLTFAVGGRETTDEYVLAGLFVFDQFGQIWAVTNPPTPEQLAGIPAVTMLAEYQAWYAAVTGQGSFSMSSSAALPRAGQSCSVCQAAYALDSVSGLLRRPVDFEDVVTEPGPFDQYRKTLSLRTDPVYLHTVRRGEKQFEPRQMVGKQLLVGDRIFGERMTIVHTACQLESATRRVQREFNDAFLAAGFTVLSMTERRNEYGSQLYTGNWFDVQTTATAEPIRVGWRKRVIDVNWERTRFRGVVTEKDSTTSSSTNAHAWGYEALTRYLRNLREGLLAESGVPA